MMELERVRDEIAAFLNRNGITAAVSWPAERRAGPAEPVVLVSLAELRCSPAGMQDYLGQREDPETGAWEEIYGRRAEMTFALDILVPPAAGAEACRALFARLAALLQAERPAGMTVRELLGGETGYDGKEGLLKLSARMTCAGWLYGRSGEEPEFTSFTLRGDVRI